MRILKLFILVVICLLTVLLCCSCGFFGPQNYYCDVDTVSSVQIVKLGECIEGEYRYEYSVICQINDYHLFVKRLNDISHSVNFGDPFTLDVGYIVIRIEYLNGDYDLIYHNAQSFNRSGKNNGGYFLFDKKQFNDLINQTINQGKISVKTVV